MFLGLYQLAMPYLDAETITSPSGSYALSIAAGEPNGGGPCTAVLSKRGAVLWRKKLPYLLGEATVDDQGNVGAVGEQWGIGYQGTPMHFVFFDQRGKILGDRTQKRHFWASDVPTAPLVGSFAAAPRRHRLAIELYEMDESDSAPGSWKRQWTEYDLRTGQVVSQKESDTYRETWPVSTEPTPISDTDQFGSYSLSQDGAATVTLCDGMGKDGSAITFPSSLIGGYEQAEQFKLVPDGPRKLLLKSADSEKEVELVLDRNSNGALAFRKPRMLTGPMPHLVAGSGDFRTVLLKSTGGIHLQNASSTNRSHEIADAAQPVESIGDISQFRVGPAPRIVLIDSRTRTVHAYDLSGKSLFATQPKAFMVDDEPIFMETVGCSPFGWIVIKGFKSSVVLDPTGRDLSESETKPSLPGLAWTDKGLVDSAGAIVVPALRRADGKWIHEGKDFAAAPDGSAAIIEGLYDRYEPQRITVFSPKGVPSHTFALKSDLMLCGIAFDGKTIVVTALEELHAFSVAGKPLWKAKLPGGSENALNRISILNGKLYGLNRKQQIVTFAMP